MTSQSVGQIDAPPTFLTHPPMASSAGPEAVELAASAGLHLDPWQVQALDVILGERPDGKWAARQVGLVVPRQNGKGSILEALELFWLFLSGEALILHSAHEFKTAKEAFLRVKQKVENTPDLHRRVLRYLQNNNDMSIELRNGQRLRFVARTGGSGRGFTGDKIVLDEAYNLPDKAVSALQPTMSAVQNPQVIITSSAPLLDEASAFLRRLSKRGREGSPSLAYLEWSAPEDADLDDRSVWAVANPGYPFRIDDEAIQSERDIMLDEDFARERLGIWSEDEAVGQVIPAENWASCAHQDSDLDGQQQFGIAVAEDRSWACIAAAGKSSHYEGCHAEIVSYQAGVRWVVNRAVELKAAWGGKFAILKGSPASSLITDLVTAGLSEDDIVEVSAEENAKHCGQLYDAVMESRFVHRGEGELNKSLQGAISRPYGDAWVWSQRKSKLDISPLVAVTSAAGLHGLGVQEMALPDVVLI